jgi:hypothetical protein
LPLLVPGLDIDLASDLSVFDLRDDMFEDAFPIREGAVDAERNPVRGDHLVGYADTEVRVANSFEEIGDLLLAEHSIRSARWRDMPVLDPFGIVGIERHPTIKVLALEGILERREVELAPLPGHSVLVFLPG